MCFDHTPIRLWNAERDRDCCMPRTIRNTTDELKALRYGREVRAHARSRLSEHLGWLDCHYLKIDQLMDNALASELDAALKNAEPLYSRRWQRFCSALTYKWRGSEFLSTAARIRRLRSALPNLLNHQIEKLHSLSSRTRLELENNSEELATLLHFINIHFYKIIPSQKQEIVKTSLQAIINVSHSSRKERFFSAMKNLIKGRGCKSTHQLAIKLLNKQMSYMKELEEKETREKSSGLNSNI